MSDSQAISRSGFAAIIGRPNVGKSTLLNAVLGVKLAIVTPKPQTTRNRIAGIATYKDCQIVFLDTPGIHEPTSSLNRVMVDVALATLDEADIVLIMLDSHKVLRNPEGAIRANADILGRLKALAKPTLLLFNKVDLIKKHELLPVLARFSEILPFQAVIPLSALKGDGVYIVLDETVKVLPPGDRYFPENQLTDRNRDFIISELVREKAFLYTQQEIPYAVAVSVDLVEERGEKRPFLYVSAVIHVERKSQKGMLIGRQGALVKRIGEEARHDIEAYLQQRIFLDLHVRVEKDWSRSMRGLKKVRFQT